MRETWLIVLVILVCAVLTFLLGPVLWPASVDIPEPTANQLPHFIFLSVVESLAFGIGIALLVFGWKVVHKYPLHKQNKAIAMLLSLVWLLVSWWPHDNLHHFNGMDLQGLLYIEYGFHLTIILAAFILTYCFITLFEPWN